MPTYDYRCAECGDFSMLRSISRRDDPCLCPSCGTSAPRALIAAPAFASMSAATRTAHATNERSAHAPRESRQHGAGCGCCSSGSSGSSVKLAGRADAVKGNAAGRPWMISH